MPICLMGSPLVLGDPHLDEEIPACLKESPLTLKNPHLPWGIPYRLRGPITGLEDPQTTYVRKGSEPRCCSCGRQDGDETKEWRR